MNRRDFLAGALAFPYLPRSLAPKLPSPLARLGRIGIELYTVRRELAADPERTLAGVAEIGYREVEFAGYPPGTPQQVRAMLDRHGLRAPASHVDFQALRSNWDRTLEQAAIIGQRFVVVPSLPANERATLEGWKRVAAAFNQAGAAARTQGLRFGYHNHDVEFPLLDGV
ncbi:MAG TPA: TIM barrel protein, partial [Gemmatimonadales bacterium]|nr:TIM barrel protein [Gemmatimonadales bacterium]